MERSTRTTRIGERRDVMPPIMISHIIVRQPSLSSFSVVVPSLHVITCFVYVVYDSPPRHANRLSTLYRQRMSMPATPMQHLHMKIQVIKTTLAIPQTNRNTMKLGSICQPLLAAVPYIPTQKATPTTKPNNRHILLQGLQLETVFLAEYDNNLYFPNDMMTCHILVHPFQ